MTTQQRTALNRANECRLLQAQLKRMLREQDRETGQLMACEVIDDPPSELAAMRIETLLKAMPGVGRTKTNRWLKLAHVSNTRRLGDLTPGERDRLGRALT